MTFPAHTFCLCERKMKEACQFPIQRVTVSSSLWILVLWSLFLGLASPTLLSWRFCPGITHIGGSTVYTWGKSSSGEGLLCSNLRFHSHDRSTDSMLLINHTRWELRTDHWNGQLDITDGFEKSYFIWNLETRTSLKRVQDRMRRDVRVRVFEEIFWGVLMKRGGEKKR